MNEFDIAGNMFLILLLGPLVVFLFFIISQIITTRKEDIGLEKLYKEYSDKELDQHCEETPLKKSLYQTVKDFLVEWEEREWRK